MRAYKFRSPTQIEFSLDIILNNRLFCSEWSKLNDPMEGIFAYSYRSGDDKAVTQLLDNIHGEQGALRICSLSKTFDCHLLWAHYAAGFSGLTIEVELPDSVPEVVDVQYRGVFGGVHLDGSSVPGQIARQILSGKNQEWAYEQEVRVIYDKHYYPLAVPVRRVICGHRMNRSLFQAIQIVCERKNIEISRTGIGDEGIDADYVAPYGESDRNPFLSTNKA